MLIEMIKTVETSGKKYEKGKVYEFDEAFSLDWIEAGYAKKSKKKSGS